MILSARWMIVRSVVDRSRNEWGPNAYLEKHFLGGFVHAYHRVRRFQAADETIAMPEAARRIRPIRSLVRDAMATGRDAIEQASVTDLPFDDATFDLVTAVETHFWWQDLAAGIREIYRVLKPGGRVLIIAEFCNGGRHVTYADRLRQFTTMAILDVGEHRSALENAGFADVHIREDTDNGWITATGTTPATAG